MFSNSRRLRSGLLLPILVVLSIVLTGCATTSRGTAGAEQRKASGDHTVSLHLSTAGRTGHPVAVLSLSNNSERPIVVDRELVFFVSLFFYDAAGERIQMRMLEEAPEPNASALKKRLVAVPPGGALERKIDLHRQMKVFMVGHGIGAGPGGFAVSRYEGFYILPRGQEPSRMEAWYGDFFESTLDVARYAGLEGAPPDIFTERLKSSAVLKPGGK